MRLLILCFVFLASFAKADPIAPRDGWVILESDKPFDQLLDDVKSAVSASGMAVVTQAGPTGAARNRGIEIPNNRVVGVFNNKFAVRILNHSTPAMIEAPIRLYLTENAGRATLSYKTPSFVFAPYLDGADPDLAVAASELDAIFAQIADAAR